MVDGWYTKTEFRKEGATAGTYDTYFFSPQGKRFRSRAEIARWFSLTAAPAPRGPGKSAEAKAAEKAAEKEAKRLAKESLLAARDEAAAAAAAYAARYPVADDVLPAEGEAAPPLPRAPAPARVPPAALIAAPRPDPAVKAEAAAAAAAAASSPPLPASRVGDS